jgi:hypothetical protein
LEIVVDPLLDKREHRKLLGDCLRVLVVRDRPAHLVFRAEPSADDQHEHLAVRYLSDASIESLASRIVENRAFFAQDGNVSERFHEVP